MKLAGIVRLFALFLALTSTKSYAVPTRYDELKLVLQDGQKETLNRKLILISDRHEVAGRPESDTYASVLVKALKSGQEKTTALFEVKEAAEGKQGATFLIRSYTQLLLNADSTNTRPVAADNRLSSLSSLPNEIKEMVNLGMGLLGRSDYPFLAKCMRTFAEQDRERQTPGQGITLNQFFSHLDEIEVNTFAKIQSQLEGRLTYSPEQLQSAWKVLRDLHDSKVSDLKRQMAILKITEEEAESTDVLLLAFKRLEEILDGPLSPVDKVSAITQIPILLSNILFTEGTVWNFEIASKSLESLIENDRVVLILGSAHNEVLLEFYRKLFPSTKADQSDLFSYQEKSKCQDPSIFYDQKHENLAVQAQFMGAEAPISLGHFSALLTGTLTTGCWHCGKPSAENPLKFCSACHEARYCSVECQKASWKIHKSECKKK